MIRRPPRSTLSSSSAASDVYKRQYQDAADILSTLKELINLKTKDYYFKGIEKYTDGNLDAAIIYWNNIEKLDPKSEYISRVKRYITDARNKQRALQQMDKKKPGKK